MIVQVSWQDCLIYLFASKTEIIEAYVTIWIRSALLHANLGYVSLLIPVGFYQDEKKSESLHCHASVLPVPEPWEFKVEHEGEDVG